MNSKNFNSEMAAICKRFGFEPTEENKYIGDTIFGQLQIYSDPEPRIKVYTVFMRFLEWDFTKHLPIFKEVYSDHDTPSNNGKWNLHLREPLHCLDMAEDRLNDMQYLLNQQNATA